MRNRAARVPRLPGEHINAFDVVFYVVCGAMALFALYPMWYVLIMSFSDPHYSLKGVFLLPRGLYFEGYKRVLYDRLMWVSAKNSLIYVVSGTVLTLATSVLMAYPLARPNLKFRKLVTFFLLIPMYWSGGVIPYYLLINKLGIYNTPWALILPGYGIFYIILVRTYFKSLPNELVDSAYIDGCNNFQTLLHIYLPLSKPVLAVVAIYSIVSIWNAWFGAMVYVPNVNYQPLQMFLKRVLVDASYNVAASTDLIGALSPEELDVLMQNVLSMKQIKYIVIVICSFPLIITYPLFQKHFVKGVMLGSLKG